MMIVVVIKLKFDELTVLSCDSNGEKRLLGFQSPFITTRFSKPEPHDGGMHGIALCKPFIMA
jgi:hypothetical protein